LNKELQRVIHTYFERISVPTYIWKVENTRFSLIFLNGIAKKNYNVEQKPLIGIKASEFYKDEPKILESLQKCYQQQKNLKSELEYCEQNEKDKHIYEINCIYLSDKFIILQRKDVTHQKSLERNLKISEIKYRHLFEKSPFYILLIDKNWNVIDCNSTIKQIIGYQKDNLIGKNLIELELIDPDLMDKLRERTELLFSNQNIKPVEMRIKNKDGEKIWIQSHPSFISYNNEKYIQLLGKDISERKKAEKRLKRSKEQFKKLSNELQIILDNVPSLIYYKDTKNNIIRVNKNYAKRLNLKVGDIIGKNASELFSEELAEKYWEHDRKIINSGKPKLNFVEPMETPNGKRWTLNSKIPINDDSGEVIGIIGVATDITDLKKAEEQLKISEKKFRKISETAQDGIYLVDENGTVYYWNKAAEKIFGYSKEEAIGTRLDKLIIPKELNQHFRQNIKTLRVTGNSPIMNKTVELKAITKRNEQIDIEVSHSTFKSKAEWNVIAIVRDITQRKKMEEKLKESEQIFRTIAERSDMGIMILQNDIPQYMNKQYANMFGYSKKEMMEWEVGQYKKCIHPENHKLVADQARKKQRGDNDVINNYEIRGVKKSGEIIWLNIYANNIKYKGSYADLITIIDITERKRAQLRLKESEQRYRKAYELSILYKDLFAHDINNILQNINSAIELEKLQSQDQEVYDSFKEFHEIIKDQVSRGHKLIKNVHKLSELEEIKNPLTNIDICELLEKSINYIKKSFPNQNIEIKVNSFQKNVKISANEFLIDVFENLLINAIKYNENEKIVINIKISREILHQKSYIKLEFMDNGIGITDDHKRTIFQSGNVKGKGGKGMGFGLTLVKKIIKDLNGEISVENRIKNSYTKGSNFIIKLPYKN